MFSHSSLVSQAFANDVGLWEVASAGGTGNFRKELIGDFNGERFHLGKAYSAIDREATKGA